MLTPNEENVRKAVDMYCALLQIELTTDTITRNARNALLRSMSADDLAAMAVELKNRGLIGGAK